MLFGRTASMENGPRKTAREPMHGSWRRLDRPCVADCATADDSAQVEGGQRRLATIAGTGPSWGPARRRVGLAGGRGASRPAAAAPRSP